MSIDRCAQLKELQLWGMAAAWRARFYNTVDLVNQLEKEKQRGKAGNLG